jgi:putative transposase
MCEKMLLLPGATGGDVTKRDGHDVEAAATMTLEEFERGSSGNLRYAAEGCELRQRRWWTDRRDMALWFARDRCCATRRFLPWVGAPLQQAGADRSPPVLARELCDPAWAQDHDPCR